MRSERMLLRAMDLEEYKYIAHLVRVTLTQIRVCFSTGIIMRDTGQLWSVVGRVVVPDSLPYEVQ